MSYQYQTTGTCAVQIDIDMDGDILKDVKFHGGCNGNLKAITSLVKGMHYDELKEKLGGIQCGTKGTSCADQMIRGIEAAMKAEA